MPQWRVSILLFCLSSCAQQHTAAPAKQPEPSRGPVTDLEERDDDGSSDDHSKRAAELAEEIGAMMNQPIVLLHLSEFGLACVVRDEATRACLEEQLGEALPDHLWAEMAVLAQNDEKLDVEAMRRAPTNPDGSQEVEDPEEATDESAIRMAVGITALACIADGKGGRAALEARMSQPLPDEAWEGLQASVNANLPELSEKWRQMREAKMVEFPQHLLGAPISGE